jgi:hypothetical protein
VTETPNRAKGNVKNSLPDSFPSDYLISPPKRLRKKIIDSELIPTKERVSIEQLNVFQRQAEIERLTNFSVKYNKSISEYYHNLNNPTFRNNSVGVALAMNVGEELPHIRQLKGNDITTDNGAL